jgi:hypothetical protein
MNWRMVNTLLEYPNLIKCQMNLEMNPDELRIVDTIRRVSKEGTAGRVQAVPAKWIIPGGA